MPQSVRLIELRRRALSRGLLGGSTKWVWVAIVIYGIRLLRWMAANNTEVIAVEGIEAGEALLIRAVPAKEAKAAARASRKGKRSRRANMGR